MVDGTENGVPDRPRKGRGAVSNRSGRFEALAKEAVDDGWGTVDEELPPLRTSLTALEQAGIEPMVVDLDTMALYRVAQWCGAFGPPEDPDEESEEVLEAILSRRLVLPIGN